MTKKKTAKRDTADEYKRFLETAKAVGASDDPKDLERALKAITRRPKG